MNGGSHDWSASRREHELPHEPRPEPAWPILDRYLARHASADEREVVDAWLADDRAARGEIAALRMVLGGEGAHAGTPPADADVQLAPRVSAILRGAAGRAAGATIRPHPAAPRLVLASGAALGTTAGAQSRGRLMARWSAALAVGAAAIAAAVLYVRPSAPVAPARVYATQTGERATITLDDGATVTLAPASRLRFHVSTEGARIAELDGRAYFTVQHEKNIPFIVRTGAIETRVLGTAFDVRHESPDAPVRVAVVTGKVAVRNATRTVTLTPGLAGEVTDSTADVLTVTPGEAARWTDGLLSFDREPVPQVLAELARWYGYEFRVSDSTIRQARITAKFDARAPREALRALEDILGITITRDGHVVTLHPSRRRDSAQPRRTKPFDSLISTEVGK